MNEIVKPVKKTLSISLDLVTISELQVLLSFNRGYIDGDSRTVELFVVYDKREVKT
jgi:hypothetical protein